LSESGLNLLKEERREMEGDPRPGRLCTSITDANIEKFGETGQKNRWLSSRAVAGLANTGKEVFDRFYMNI
jgi:hypothetical protein